MLVAVKVINQEDRTATIPETIVADSVPSVRVFTRKELIRQNVISRMKAVSAPKVSELVSSRVADSVLIALVTIIIMIISRVAAISSARVVISSARVAISSARAATSSAVAINKAATASKVAMTPMQNTA